MASGKDLRRRIASVKNTQQITKAMKMVAAARLRRAQEAIQNARPFAAGIKEVIAGLSASAGDGAEHPLLAKRVVKKVNVIVITSDRGLCGGFNTNLLKRAEAMYRDDAGKYEKLVFTCLGRKGFEYLGIKKIPVHKNYTDFHRGLTYAKIAAIADEIIESFLSGEFDEIRIIYAEFKSAILQIPRQETLLPIALEAGKDAAASAAAVTAEYVYEPAADQILAQILPRYIKVSLHTAILETQASEHGARMAAMDSATKNAGEMIKKLTLEYNKVRQAGITRELLEIVAGAEALK